MINTSEILQTVRMITEEKLDIRTITMGISLYDCVHPDKDILYRNVYDRITTQAKDLVRTGEALEREFGIPIVNKRISVTPASLVAAACGDPVVVARAMDAAAKETGVNYIGGYTALVQKGMTASDRALIASLPEALSTTERVCSSVNVASTRAGIDMDAVRLCGQAVKDIAAATADTDASGCMKLVVFANAVEDNPFMAGAFHGPGEGDCCINVGISGPGVVKRALENEVDAIKNGEYVHLYLDSIINWIDANLQCLVARIVKFVCFGLGDDGHFKAYIPATWQFLQFDTGMNPDDSETYGHLIIKW